MYCNADQSNFSEGFSLFYKYCKIFCTAVKSPIKDQAMNLCVGLYSIEVFRYMLLLAVHKKT